MNEFAERRDVIGQYLFLLTDSHLIGFSTSICVICHRIAGFHKIASSTPRAAEGVMTSYETLSTFISGRVKQAFRPHTLSLNILLLLTSYLLSLNYKLIGSKL